MTLIVDKVATSTYSFDKLRDHYSNFAREIKSPGYEHIPFADFCTYDAEIATCFPQSSSYEFTTVGRDLSKGSGEPSMGPKKDNLNAARLYANKIKDDPTTPAFVYLPGIRTQPDKVRGIWQDPISEWVLEIEEFDSAIQKASEYAKQDNHYVSTFYCTPEHLHKYIFQDGVQQFVVLDYKMYDSTLSAEEIADHMRYMAPNHPAIEHSIHHAVSGPIQMPDQLIQRLGCLTSGKINTNITGGAKNFQGGFKTFEKMKLDKYIKRAAINGDDNLWAFDTVINSRNLEKFAKAISPRVLEPSKCYMDTTSAWFSKIFFTEEYFTKPMSLVVYGLIHREHEMSPDVQSKEYLAIAVAQKIEWLKGYPEGLGEQLAKEIKSCDKYPINTFSTQELQPAWDAYLRTHSYLEEQGRIGELQTLQNGMYATV